MDWTLINRLIEERKKRLAAEKEQRILEDPKSNEIPRFSPLQIVKERAREKGNKTKN